MFPRTERASADVMQTAETRADASCGRGLTPQLAKRSHEETAWRVQDALFSQARALRDNC